MDSRDTMTHTCLQTCTANVFFSSENEMASPDFKVKIRNFISSISMIMFNYTDLKYLHSF